jgi:hypothetical protein
MSVRKESSFWRVCVLGALNGLLCGKVAEVVYKIHLWYEVDHFNIPLNYLLRLSPLPFVLAFSFMTSSYLIHRYWLSRPKSLLILWQVIGFAAVSGFVVVMFLIKSSANFYRLPEFFMKWLVGIILVALVNLLYGLVIQLATKHYLQEKGARNDAAEQPINALSGLYR